MGDFEEGDVGPMVEDWEVWFGEVWRSVGWAVVACEVRWWLVDVLDWLDGAGKAGWLTTNR